MLKNSENNGMEEIGLVTPTPEKVFKYSTHLCHFIGDMFYTDIYIKLQNIAVLQIMKKQQQVAGLHYSDVTSPATRLFIQRVHFHSYNNENIKIRITYLSWWGSTSHRWVRLTEGK